MKDQMKKNREAKCSYASSCIIILMKLPTNYKFPFTKKIKQKIKNFKLKNNLYK